MTITARCAHTTGVVYYLAPGAKQWDYNGIRLRLLGYIVHRTGIERVSLVGGKGFAGTVFFENVGHAMYFMVDAIVIFIAFHVG